MNPVPQIGRTRVRSRVVGRPRVVDLDKRSERTESSTSSTTKTKKIATPSQADRQNRMIARTIHCIFQIPQDVESQIPCQPFGRCPRDCVLRLAHGLGEYGHCSDQYSDQRVTRMRERNCWVVARPARCSSRTRDCISPVSTVCGHCSPFLPAKFVNNSKETGGRADLQYH